MTIEWRAGLRVSEALPLEVRDLSLAVELPTVRVRRGKCRKARIVPHIRSWELRFRRRLRGKAMDSTEEGRARIRRATPEPRSK